jgi:hypothetical protein
VDKPHRRDRGKLEWSRRRLVERFREEIGLPPKAIARIVRFLRRACDG